MISRSVRWEFKDCTVEVVGKGNVADSDGLIGMDVLSHFLVTLDYPMRKLLLAPLPPRPNDTSGLKPTLQTRATRTKTNLLTPPPRRLHPRRSPLRMVLTTVTSRPK